MQFICAPSTLAAYLYVCREQIDMNLEEGTTSHTVKKVVIKVVLPAIATTRHHISLCIVHNQPAYGAHQRSRCVPRCQLGVVWVGNECSTKSETTSLAKQWNVYVRLLPSVHKLALIGSITEYQMQNIL